MDYMGNVRGVWTSSDPSVKTHNPETDYEIVTPSGKKVKPSQGRCWSVSKKRFQELVDDNRICLVRMEKMFRD